MTRGRNWLGALSLSLAPLAGLASGCAQNAIFEVYVELPPTVMIEGGGEARFARIVALPIVTSSDTTFDGSRSRVVPLTGSRQFLGLTLMRGGGFQGSAVTVRVLYCEAEADCDPVQPEQWAGSEDLVFEHAFYVGQNTCYAHELSDDDLTDGLALPTSQTEVGVCQVGGCTTDDFVAASADFCRLGTAQHFCAAGQTGDVCDRLHTTLAPMLAPGG